MALPILERGQRPTESQLSALHHVTVAFFAWLSILGVLCVIIFLFAVCVCVAGVDQESCWRWLFMLTTEGPAAADGRRSTADGTWRARLESPLGDWPPRYSGTRHQSKLPRLFSISSFCLRHLRPSPMVHSR